MSLVCFNCQEAMTVSQIPQAPRNRMWLPLVCPAVLLGLGKLEIRLLSFMFAQIVANYVDEYYYSDLCSEA